MSPFSDAEMAYYEHRGLGPEHAHCDECDRLWQAVVDAHLPRVFCSDHQTAHGPHEFIRGARRFNCPGRPGGPGDAV